MCIGVGVTTIPFMRLFLPSGDFTGTKMLFREEVKCAILECKVLIFDVFAHAINQPVDEDDEFPRNM